MEIKSIDSEAFSRYGRVLEGYDFGPVLKMLEQVEMPKEGVVYVPSCKEMEALPILKEMEDFEFGGMPLQIGYCLGTNTKLNSLEYHKGSEINAFTSNTILLLGCVQDIKEGKYDSSKVEAFSVPGGVGVEVYATTLHYAPINGKGNDCFRSLVFLPKNTNTEYHLTEKKSQEDELLFARNKWLLTFADTDDAKAGAYVGLFGENYDLKEL